MQRSKWKISRIGPILRTILAILVNQRRKEKQPKARFPALMINVIAGVLAPVLSVGIGKALFGLPTEDNVSASFGGAVLLVICTWLIPDHLWPDHERSGSLIIFGLMVGIVLIGRW